MGGLLVDIYHELERFGIIASYKIGWSHVYFSIDGENYIIRKEEDELDNGSFSDPYFTIEDDDVIFNSFNTAEEMLNYVLRKFILVEI